MYECIHNKVDTYIRQRKNDLHERNLLLKTKLNKNIVEIENIDLKIKEIDDKVDVAMEIFSPRNHLSDFTKEEIHNLVEKKKNLIEINKEITVDIKNLSAEISQIDESLVELENIDNLIKEINKEKKELEEDNSETNSSDDENSKKETDSFSVITIIKETYTQELLDCIHKIELCNKIVDIDPIRTKLELEILKNTINNTISEMDKLVNEFITSDDIDVVTQD